MDRDLSDERPRSCSGKRIRRLWKQKPHSNKRGGLSIVWWEEKEMARSEEEEDGGFSETAEKRDGGDGQ